MNIGFKDWNKQFIGGEWRIGKSQTQYTNRNPYDQSELATIQLASQEEIDEAYKSAQKAQIEWQKMNPYAHGRLSSTKPPSWHKNTAII